MVANMMGFNWISSIHCLGVGLMLGDNGLRHVCVCL